MPKGTSAARAGKKTRKGSAHEGSRKKAVGPKTDRPKTDRPKTYRQKAAPRKVASGGTQLGSPKHRTQLSTADRSDRDLDDRGQEGGGAIGAGARAGALGRDVGGVARGGEWAGDRAGEHGDGDGSDSSGFGGGFGGEFGGGDGTQSVTDGPQAASAAAASNQPITHVLFSTKMGKVCHNENTSMESVAILRERVKDGCGSKVLAASNGKVIAVVAQEIADDANTPPHKLPQSVPAALATGSGKYPNTIVIGAGVNHSLFGPDMVAVSNALGRFAPVRDAIPFPAAACEVLPVVDDQWVCLEVNVQQLLDLVHAINTSEAESGPHTVFVGVHHTKNVMVVQGDIGGGALMVEQRREQDFGTYHKVRSMMRRAQGKPGDGEAETRDGAGKVGRNSVTITTAGVDGQQRSVTLTPKTFENAARIADRLKATPLRELSEEEVKKLLLRKVPGVNPVTAERLEQAGIVTISNYATQAAERRGVREIRGIGPKKAEALEEAVNALWARWARERKEDQTPAAGPEDGPPDVPTEGPPEPETMEE